MWSEEEHEENFEASIFAYLDQPPTRSGPPIKDTALVRSRSYSMTPQTLMLSPANLTSEREGSWALSDV